MSVLKAMLRMELAHLIERRGMTQAQAAESFGVTKPRVSDIVTDLFFKGTLSCNALHF